MMRAGLAERCKAGKGDGGLGDGKGGTRCGAWLGGGKEGTGDGGEVYDGAAMAATERERRASVRARWESRRELVARAARASLRRWVLR